MKRSQVLITELQPLDQVCIVLGMGYVILFMNINSRIVFAVGFGGIFSIRLEYKSTSRFGIVAFRGAISTSGCRGRGSGALSRWSFILLLGFDAFPLFSDRNMSRD
jgi:hypothetical protein